MVNKTESVLDVSNPVMYFKKMADYVLSRYGTSKKLIPKQDIRDCRQELDLAILKAMHTFNIECNTALPAYVYMCLKYRVLNFVRDYMRYTTRNQASGLLTTLRPAPDPAEAVIYADLVRYIRSKLTRMDRMLLGLYMDGLTYEEIGRNLKMSKQRAFIRTKLVLARVQQLLAHEGVDCGQPT